MSGGLVRGRAWLLIVLASIVPYLPCVRGQWVFDDTGLILDNAAVVSPTPVAVWTSPYWPDSPRTGLYRPWTSLTYWVDAHIFGLHPAPFHAVNLLLHAGVSLLFWLLLRRLFPRRHRVALAAALLAALHPLRSEAVAWVVGRSELLAAFWGLLAYLLALAYASPGAAEGKAPGTATGTAPGGRSWLLPASAGAFLLAVLSKENAVGLGLLPLLHQRDPEGRGRFRAVLAAWALPVLLTFLLRIRVLGGLMTLQTVSLSDNVLAHVPAWERVLCAFGFQWRFLADLVVPWQLSPDYSYPQLLPSATWELSGALLCLLGGWWLWRCYRRGNRDQLWGWAFTLAAGVLTSNVLFPIGTLLAERLTYLPSLGAIWCLADAGDRGLAGARKRSDTAGRVLLAVLAVWGFGLGVRTWVRALDWRDGMTLFSAAARTSPRSARVHTDYAHAYKVTNRLEEAVVEGKRALALYPGYPPAIEVTAACLDALGRAQEACDLAEPVVRSGVRDPMLMLALGNVYLDLHRPQEADAIFSEVARSLPDDDSRPRIGHASALAQELKWREAAAAWKNAVSVSEGDVAVARNWAYSLWQAGAADSAEVIYRRLLEKGQPTPETINDVAWFLAESGRNPVEAIGLARRAFAAQPGANTADTLVEALLRKGDCAGARAWADSLSRGAQAALFPAVQATLERQCPGQTRTTPER